MKSSTAVEDVRVSSTTSADAWLRAWKRSAHRRSTAQAVQNTQLFLAGRTDELVSDLTNRMKEAAASERFEQAAHLRDAIRTVRTLQERQQKIATARLGDRDAFGLKVGPAGAVVQVFQMRRGRVIERIELMTETGAATSDAEILEASVQQFYEDREVPPEIHLPLAPDAAELEVLEAWLSQKAGQKVTVSVPKRGDRRGLVELANRNAALAYDGRFNEPAVANYEALETLRQVLSLPALPRRIECFDISTIQGSDTVASMVVCEAGRMKKGEYRKFRIKGIDPESAGDAAVAETRNGITTEVTETTETFLNKNNKSDSVSSVSSVVGAVRGSDDFAAMYEVVLRRYRKVLEQGGPFPELILIDGGKGQLTSAYLALEALGLANLVALGLAKKEEADLRAGVDGAHCAADRLGGTAASAAHSRRSAPLRGHLSPPGAQHARPAVGARRRRRHRTPPPTRLAPPLRKRRRVCGVRLAKSSLSVVGPKIADLVLSYFAQSGEARRGWTHP